MAFSTRGRASISDSDDDDNDDEIEEPESDEDDTSSDMTSQERAFIASDDDDVMAQSNKRQRQAELTPTAAAASIIPTTAPTMASSSSATAPVIASPVPMPTTAVAAAAAIAAAPPIPATAAVAAVAAAVATVECPVCLGFLLDPMAFACAHHVCDECGDTLVADSAARGRTATATPCPLCRAPSAPVAALDGRRWLAAWQPAARAAALAARAERNDPDVLLAAMSRRAQCRATLHASNAPAQQDILVVLRVVDGFYAWLARNRGTTYGVEPPRTAVGDEVLHTSFDTFMGKLPSLCAVIMLRHDAVGADAVPRLYHTDIARMNAMVSVRVTPHTLFLFMLRRRTLANDKAPLIYGTKQ